MRSRVQAEEIVLQYAKEQGLPAVAMCVSTTYGAGDWGRTPHGAIIAGTAFGKLPFVMDKIELEAVGVDDAARAMILAAEHGRVGERYLISEKMISNAEVVRIAAEAAGVPAPTKSIPLPVSYATGRARQRQGEAARHRRTTLDGLAAADARRSAGGLHARPYANWVGSHGPSRSRSARRPGSGSGLREAKAQEQVDPSEGSSPASLRAGHSRSDPAVRMASRSSATPARPK